jgi:hypothetical protein
LLSIIQVWARDFRFHGSYFYSSKSSTPDRIMLLKVTFFDYEDDDEDDWRIMIHGNLEP